MKSIFKDKVFFLKMALILKIFKWFENQIFINYFYENVGEVENFCIFAAANLG